MTFRTIERKRTIDERLRSSKGAVSIQPLLVLPS